jgi:multisubunit Na+/H+ antiporter MnhB subunit
MNFEVGFSIALALLILAVAVFTIGTRDSFAAVVAFVVYGLLLSLGWMNLYCPDVALTEAAVGGGVTGALLLNACARVRNEKTSDAETSSRWIGRGLAALVCLVLFFGLVAVVIVLPSPAPTLASEATKNLSATGLGNPVTAVLMAYRALDTMLEKVVLLLALVAVWSLASDRFWGGRATFVHLPEPDRPLIFLTRVLAPVGIIAGIYLFWVGADAPGGAFAGGAIISAIWILAFFAGLSVVPAVGSFGLRIVLSIGIIIFLAAGVAGISVAAGFLAYPEGFAKPIIIVIEIAMTLSIGATLGLLVAGPPAQSLKP